MKTLPIITEGQYSYAVDIAGEIKVGDWYINEYNHIKKVFKCNDLSFYKGTNKKVIGSDNPKFSGIPKLRVPVQEDDELEQMAKDWTKSRGYTNSSMDDKYLWSREQTSFKAGYKANTKQFTLEQIEDAIDKARQRDMDGCWIYERTEIMESLTTPKLPTAIEVEVDCENYWKNSGSSECTSPKCNCKPTVDDEGYLVGTLKYD